MNNRIKELALQANLTIVKPTMEYDRQEIRWIGWDNELAGFVRLIIQECTNAIREEVKRFPARDLDWIGGMNEAVLDKLGDVDESVNEICKAAEKYYKANEDVCMYHNYSHALSVVEATRQLTNARPSAALMLAATWHDAVYHPGAYADANEQCSAAALGRVARRLGKVTPLSQSVENSVVLAQDLIVCTSIKHHLSSQRIFGDLAVLLDADLRSLAVTDFDEFVRFQECIIEENNGNIPGDYMTSAEFLHKFLTCRDYIYHTDKGRELWEWQARSNINLWHEKLSNK